MLTAQIYGSDVFDTIHAAIVASIKTPALAVGFVRSFDNLLAAAPPTAPVMVVADGGVVYDRQNGRVNVSDAYLEALIAAAAFATGEQYRVTKNVVGERTLGNISEVRALNNNVIYQIEDQPSGNVMPTKLYSRKTAIGIAAGTAIVAGLAVFAIGWAHKEEPSAIIYPGRY